MLDCRAHTYYQAKIAAAAAVQSAGENRSEKSDDIPMSI